MDVRVGLGDGAVTLGAVVASMVVNSLTLANSTCSTTVSIALGTWGTTAVPPGLGEVGLGADLGEPVGGVDLGCGADLGLLPDPFLWEGFPLVEVFFLPRGMVTKCDFEGWLI